MRPGHSSRCVESRFDKPCRGLLEASHFTFPPRADSARLPPLEPPGRIRTMSVADERLLEKVARGLNEPVGGRPTRLRRPPSSASRRASTARGPSTDETTIPTGFDPAGGGALRSHRRSCVPGRSADGVLDDSEREAFVQVVIEACGGAVDEQQVQRPPGRSRASSSKKTASTRASRRSAARRQARAQREVLRIAGLLAHVSGGVSEVERDVLGKLAAAFHLDPGEVDAALDAVKSALA